MCCEDVADNLFNPDPYYQQGCDMVRAGGLAYTIEIAKPVGGRISDMTLLRTGEKIDSSKKYTVSGWPRSTKAPRVRPVYDVVASYIQRVKSVRIRAQSPGQGGGRRRCGLPARLKGGQVMEAAFCPAGRLARAGVGNRIRG